KPAYYKRDHADQRRSRKHHDNVVAWQREKPPGRACIKREIIRQAAGQVSLTKSGRPRSFYPGAFVLFSPGKRTAASVKPSTRYRRHFEPRVDQAFSQLGHQLACSRVIGIEELVENDDSHLESRVLSLES